MSARSSDPCLVPRGIGRYLTLRMPRRADLYPAGSPLARLRKRGRERGLPNLRQQSGEQHSCGGEFIRQGQRSCPLQHVRAALRSAWRLKSPPQRLASPIPKWHPLPARLIAERRVIMGGHENRQIPPGDPQLALPLHHSDALVGPDHERPLRRGVGAPTLCLNL